jgi:hypothetical protein
VYVISFKIGDSSYFFAQPKDYNDLSANASFEERASLLSTDGGQYEYVLMILTSMTHRVILSPEYDAMRYNKLYENWTRAS